MESPPALPQSIRSRVLSVVVEGLFVGYLAGALVAALASAVLMARAGYIAFDVWPGFAVMVGLALQTCKLGLLLFGDGTEGRLIRVAGILLVTVSMVASCAAIAGALHVNGIGAIAVALLIATALEVTVATAFLSLRGRAQTSLAEGDVLDGVARETVAIFRRQFARHAGLRHEVAGHVRAMRSGLRNGGVSENKEDPSDRQISVRNNPANRVSE